LRASFRSVVLPLVVVALVACGQPAVRTAPKAAPTPTPAPTPAPTAEPLPEAEMPLPPEAPPEPPPEPPPAAFPSGADITVRVGLLSDQTGISFPAGAPELRVTWEGQTWKVISGVRIEPAPGSTEAGVFRVQVAALRDEGQATALASNLRRTSGEAVDSVFDAESGLYRVRFGRYVTRDEADQARRGLARYGVGDAWVVSEGGSVRQPALRVTQAGQSVSIPGRWAAMESPGGDGIAVGKGRYRGRILVFLNDRGTLNVIDELPLEQYLRGVVPSELGPAQYPEVEALKAQAVAARTYAVRTLGEFRQEGFDICATPRCQAYDGMGVEHPRSDQAVAATRGQILLWEGQPIDALYSATCGGHTEDVGVVFPLKKGEPYLKGVPCMEAGVAQLGGAIASGTWPHTVVAALLGAGADAPQAYGEQLLLLARLAGVPAQPAVLQSFDAREVRRFVAATFDLALDARLFVAAEDLPYLVQAPPVGWSEEDRRLAALFVKLGLTEGTAAQLQPADRDDLLYHLAVYLRVLREESATFLALGGGQIHVRATDKEAKERDVTIAPTLLTFRRSGEVTTASTLALVPGDELQLVWQGDALVGLVQTVHPQGVAYDRSSSWSSWHRYRSDKDLQTLVQQRYPGFPFRGLEIVSRGVSGRVGELRLLGADGKSELVDGLAVRWTLDLPDTLFTARRLVPERGDPGWLFTGRGWGHGVGLCQVGAYGMALRGHDYTEILAHYYPGARLGGIPTQVRAASTAARAAAAAAVVSTRR